MTADRTVPSGESRGRGAHRRAHTESHDLGGVDGTAGVQLDAVVSDRPRPGHGTRGPTEPVFANECERMTGGQAGPRFAGNDLPTIRMVALPEWLFEPIVDGPDAGLPDWPT